MIVIGNKSYEVLKDHRNGWNLEAFRERYSEVLDRYDYIVGDWGYNQLRLKGFYRDNHPKAPRTLPSPACPITLTNTAILVVLTSCFRNQGAEG